MIRDADDDGPINAIADRPDDPHADADHDYRNWLQMMGMRCPECDAAIKAKRVKALGADLWECPACRAYWFAP